MAAFLMLSCVHYSFAGDRSISVHVTATQIQTGTTTYPDPEYPEKDEYGQRKPVRHITCTIDSASGIEFIGQVTPDFILYEIYDINNVCTGAYGDEAEFIGALFSLTGEYRISLSTAEASYTGYVML